MNEGIHSHTHNLFDFFPRIFELFHFLSHLCPLHLHIYINILPIEWLKKYLYLYTRVNLFSMQLICTKKRVFRDMKFLFFIAFIKSHLKNLIIMIIIFLRADS